MLSDMAPKSYRQRVALEKARIQALMAEAPETVKASWGTLRVTRRFALDSNAKLYAWDGKTVGEPAAEFSIVDASFTYSKGLSANIRVKDPNDDGSTVDIVVSGTPTLVYRNVLMNLDMVEPFVKYGNDTHVCLIVYSGAGVVGDWEPGTVVGTKEEFENYGV